MKTVILFRHGKSDWDAIYARDHDRPLSKRGIKASKKMGEHLSKINEIPSLVLCSTSLRTRSTLKHAYKKGNWDSAINFEKSIYHSKLSSIIELLRKQNDFYNRICIIGHEPTFSNIIYKYQDLHNFTFPTACMAKIDFECEVWKDIKFGFKSSLRWILRPKDIN